MPLTEKVLFSKIVTLPNKMKTLALFGKKGLIEYRACECKKGKCHCPNKKTHPQERLALQKKLGINPLNRQLKK